jgi:hypothetical protein
MKTDDIKSVIATLFAEGVTPEDLYAAIGRLSDSTNCATPAEIAEAREKYRTDECEIDDEAWASRGDDGVWVAAWVWLRNK